jgi:virulence factor Mce-like protein
VRTRSTRRTDAERPLRVIAAGAATVGVLAVLALLALQSPRSVPFIGARTIYATLPETGNLRVHSEVRARGVRVGEVTDVAPADEGAARVRLKLDPGTALPADTTAQVRGKGLLGARYVDLHPGSSRTGVRPGATLRAGAEASTLSVPDALETFDVQTRGGLRSTLNELGEGLAGRGPDVNRLFGFAPIGGHATIELVDTLDRGAVRALVPSVAQASTALDGARDDIAAGFAPTDRALRPFVDHRAQTQAALTAAPPALAAAQPAFEEGRGLLASARALAAAAQTTLPRAPAGLREVTALLEGSARPLARTATLLDAAGPAVPAALRVTRALSPLLPRLQDAGVHLAPIVTGLGRYSCDLAELGDNWRSVLNQGVPGGGEIGPLTSFRITALGTAESLAAFAPDQGTQEPFSAPCKYSSPPTRYGR